MGKSVLEWNTSDVLQRKYNESWVIFEDQAGLLQQLYVQSCESGPVFYTNKGHTNLQPVYYPIERGYYVSAKEETFFLERKFSPHKSFKIGLCADNWYMFKVNTGTGEQNQQTIASVELDLLHPPENKRFLVRGIGVVNRKYMITNNQIFFKGHQIGSKEGKILVLDNLYFLKDLKDTLGPEWQIS